MKLLMKYMLFTAICLMLPITVSAKDIVFAISAKTGSLQQQTAAEFTRLANERLPAGTKVILYDNAQLGKDKDLMQKVKIGTVQITLPSSVMPNVAGEFALFDMPFLIKDRDHLARLQSVLFDSILAPAAEEKGYKVLGVWENGIRHITNNSRPIDTPNDLKGLKIRTPKSSWRVKMFKEWGANPTPMSFSEVFVALQTGVIDGQENPLTNISSAKLNEVQKYLSITGHVYSPAYPTVSTEHFAKLNKQVQEVLLQTAREVQYWARMKGKEADQQLLSALESKGMKVNVANRQSFVDRSKPIYKDFASEVDGGQNLIDIALRLAE